MEELSILSDVKKAIGLMPEYDAFDQTPHHAYQFGIYDLSSDGCRRQERIQTYHWRRNVD